MAAQRPGIWFGFPIIMEGRVLAKIVRLFLLGQVC